jgi:putative ABC transport system substrate-binding protein
MRRRDFIALVGGGVGASWAFAAAAQQATTPLIGFLLPGSKVASKRFLDGFPLGMEQRGYVKDRSYVLEVRYADSDFSRLPFLAKELLHLKPYLVVAATSSAALAVKQVTDSTPIVGINLVDPVGMGLVNSEARPGTNVTGTLQYLPGLAGKQVELLHDLIPNMTKIGVLANASASSPAFNATQQHEAEVAAAKLRISLTLREVRTADDIGPAFQTFVQERVNGVVVLRDTLFLALRQQIAAFALASHMPTIFGFREDVESGGLLSYGIDLRAAYMRAAFYVDKILKGEKPADLPIEFPTKLELVLNTATAKALGVTVPSSMIMRADEVIE